MEILRLENVSFAYPQSSGRAVRDVSFSVEAGDFVTVCGPTGSGKTTLLRLLKCEIAPRGELSGKIYLEGRTFDEFTEACLASTVGFVMQSPAHQLVTDRVWHELAFSLENFNVDRSTAARRIAEISAYFGIERLLDRRCDELSGGEAQLVALASVMVMSPRVLILDEPTSRLDPVAAADFIASLRRLNRDTGLTVIISEHRTEELICDGDKLLFMENGKVSYYGEATRAVSSDARSSLLPFMPSAARIFSSLGGEGACPLDVRGGRRFLDGLSTERFGSLASTINGEGKRGKTTCSDSTLNDVTHDIDTSGKKHHGEMTERALEFKNVSFRYARELPDVLSSLSFKVNKGEIFCILGANGSGKSTALGAAAGLYHPYSGEIRVFGKKLRDYKNGSLYDGCLSLLVQEINSVFVKSTVREELGDAPVPFDISDLLDRHPYDLSGGEAQLVALARVLATSPRLLMLDEPTKGLDAPYRERLVEILKKLKENGTTVLCVTHDTTLAASCADRCAMFFRGQIVSVAPTREFFAANEIYTTAVGRMTCRRSFASVTEEELLTRFGVNTSEEKSL